MSQIEEPVVGALYWIWVGDYATAEPHLGVHTGGGINKLGRAFQTDVGLVWVKASEIWRIGDRVLLAPPRFKPARAHCSNIHRLRPLHDPRR